MATDMETTERVDKLLDAVLKLSEYVLEIAERLTDLEEKPEGKQNGG